MKWTHRGHKICVSVTLHSTKMKGGKIF